MSAQQDTRLFSLRPEKEASILSDWNKALASNRGNLLSFEELANTLAIHLRPDAPVEPIPGAFGFGNHPEILWVIYKDLFANEEVGHEMEHAQVYTRNGISVNYGLVVSTVGESGLHYRAIVSPVFSEDISEERQKEIFLEAAAAPRELSAGDMLAQCKKLPQRERFTEELDREFKGRLSGLDRGEEV